MVANIEQEYSNYVCNVWQEISNISKHSLEQHQEPEQMYDAISVASNQFLQEKEGEWRAGAGCINFISV